MIDIGLHSKIWRSKDEDLAPEWAHRIIVRECLRQRIQPMRLKFVQPDGVFHYGGRYYPEVNGIGVVDVGDESFQRAVLCHELTHGVGARKLNFVGRHDAPFYKLAEDIYSRYGVSLATAKAIEDNPIPKSWRERQRW